MKYLLVLTTLALLLLTPIQVYGHGLGRETIGPKNAGDMLVSLDINLQPEIREADKQVDVTLSIKAIDEESKDPIKGIIVYDITVSKYATEQVFKERFHARQGQDELRIVFKPNADAEPRIIKGMYMDYMGYGDDENIVIEGPIFLDAGLYIIDVDIVALNERQLDSPVRYTARLTIAEEKIWSISYEDIKGNLTTISYFERLSDLKIYKDNSGNYRIDAISGFNWSREFVKDISLLHFEYYIPKDMHELAMRELKGYINNIEVPITVDRSAEGYVIVHYMIPNSRLMSMIEQVQDKDMLIFSIVTGNMIEGIEGGSEGTDAGNVNVTSWSEPIRVKSSNNSFIVEVRYSPVEPSIDDQIVFNIKLYDANTMQEIKSMRYDIMLYDSNGNHIDRSHRSVQTKDTQVYKVDAPDTYKVVLTNINRSGESASFTITVVPEFPVALLVMGIGAATAIAVRRLRYG